MHGELWFFISSELSYRLSHTMQQAGWHCQGGEECPCISQYKSSMGRTRKSSGSVKTSKINFPTEEQHVNPCSAINSVTHSFLPWTIAKSLLSLRLQICMSWLLVTWGFCYIGRSEVLRSVPSELFGFVWIAFLLILFSSSSVCPQNLRPAWLRSIFLSQSPKTFS